MNRYDSINLINSDNFASSSNLIYAQRIGNKLYNNSSDKKIINISNDENFSCTTYKLKNFELNENDVIFCNTDYIDSLFFHLNGLHNFKNLKLITNQTDQFITKKIFKKKPRCVSNWYSVNVGVNDDHLISIPLGLASNFSKKNLTSDYFLNKINVSNFKKENINMYINFVSNTNFKERGGLYQKFENQEWVTTRKPTIGLYEYQKDLVEKSFVLCPQGNGIDTHRIWETLYSGSIPIVKKHLNFSCATNLPILFVDSYDDINFNLLNDFMNDLNVDHINLDQLNFDFWLNKIIHEDPDTTNNIFINEGKFVLSFFLYKKIILDFVKGKVVKRFKTFYRRLKKLTS